MKQRDKIVHDNDLNTSGGKWGHFFGGVTVGTLGTLALAVAAAAVGNKKQDDKKMKMKKTNEISYIPPSPSLSAYDQGNVVGPYTKIYPYLYK